MKTTYANLRINILGAKGVGKSAITVRYLTKRFIGEYSSGLDISYQTTVTHGDLPIKVDILDVSSQDECQASCHDLYDADGFVVVYSVTDTESFKVAQKEVQTIRSRTPPHTPILLLGNKLDLDHARKVCKDDVCQLKSSYDCLHTEVSAAESHVMVVSQLQALMVQTLSALCQKGRPIKRRKSLFENMSKKLGSVFRRRSLEDTPHTKKKLMRVSHHHINRRSV
ncbi:ras-related and estrogen-regulated growth inhibitor-like protein [Physella acuta]|uniref:ras-related and estrogen-regulated growth inhibitor-like protein n=1 Tax=Physella acuta TaxID=109671 RepID=UPI0027DAFFFD|nr:ras-related and estrogen-regulated growth inhibitor-like protein [Physella acuta]